MKKEELPFEAKELALMMTMAYHTMHVLRDNPDKLEDILDPANGLTRDLFDQVLMKLDAFRVAAQIAQVLENSGVVPAEDDSGDDDDPNDLANMKPAGNA